jgi:CRP-like cAMP-binding protein
MKLFSHDTKIDALKQVPLFEGLSKKELTRLAQGTEDLELSSGTVLCREGGLAREFFVLVEGTVEVTKDGKRLATLVGGDFVGEIALINHSPRTATVTATSQVHCFVLTSGEFRRALDDNRNIERKVMQALAARVAALSGVETV